jgi:hypothetical protein
MSDVAYYDRFTTRVEVARQAGVCYYTPALLEAKVTQLKVGDYDTPADDQQKKIREQFEQEYLASLFLNSSSAKLHTQLKKDVANDYSKGNTDAYPTDIHKALKLMNEYKPLKLDAPTVPAQGTAFATNGKQGQKKGGDKKSPEHDDYIKASDWNKMTPEARTKIIEARKKKSKTAYDDDRSVASVKLYRNYDVICIDVAGKEKRMSSEHYGFSFWRHFPPVASGTVVVCKNNTRVLGRSGHATQNSVALLKIQNSDIGIMPPHDGPTTMPR